MSNVQVKAAPVSRVNVNKVCSALDPDKENKLELPVDTLTVHDEGVNQGLLKVVNCRAGGSACVFVSTWRCCTLHGTAHDA